MSRFACNLAALLAPLAAHAEAARPFASPAVVNAVTPSGIGSLGQVTLALVLAVIFGAAWGLRRVRGFGKPSAAALDVVAHLLSAVVRVLQGLLAERVPIRNMRAIIETLAAHAPRTPDPAALQGHVRAALGRQIVQEIAGIAGELPVITQEPNLERLLQSSLTNSNSASPGLDLGLAEHLQQRLSESAQRQGLSGEPAVLLVPPQLRPTLARFMRSSVPNMHVLAWKEIPDNRKVRLVTAVGR